MNAEKRRRIALWLQVQFESSPARKVLGRPLTDDEAWSIAGGWKVRIGYALVRFSEHAQYARSRLP